MKKPSERRLKCKEEVVKNEKQVISSDLISSHLWWHGVWNERGRIKGMPKNH